MFGEMHFALSEHKGNEGKIGWKKMSPDEKG